MNVQPLSDRVLVKPLTESETTKSGIIIPDTVEKEKPEKGEIIAVGPGKMLDNGQRAPMTVKIGDKVIFKNSYGTKEIPKDIVDGKELYLIEESDVLAVIS